MNVCTKLPESCGPARQICKGERDMIIVGTIKNNILLGSFDKDFTYMIQVNSSCIFLDSISRQITDEI